MDIEILRAELMRFTKEELVTELLAALIEISKAHGLLPTDDNQRELAGEVIYEVATNRNRSK